MQKTFFWDPLLLGILQTRKNWQVTYGNQLKEVSTEDAANKQKVPLSTFFFFGYEKFQLLFLSIMHGFANFQKVQFYQAITL